MFYISQLEENHLHFAFALHLSIERVLARELSIEVSLLPY